MQLPIIKTSRLILKPFQIDDSKSVHLLADDIKIASTTGTIPHPYKLSDAESWINTHVDNWQKKNSLTLSVCLNEKNKIIGAIELILKLQHKRAELAYWIGFPFWNRGYCTEASKAIVSYGFNQLDLRKITAHHMLSNPASGKVMEKLGMKREGVFEQHFIRFGEFQDMAAYGVLRENFKCLELE
ncbi:MAG: GNAT family N-acetyltransferase [Bacteriovoracaceae bacterium]|jgi:RimJ/RimL family protein N-acetyltransferase|nr:GNAT family N-acetyltransferase [Bacteriovoracaceae bacterium]